jgi:hypothetical protein
MTLVGSIIGQPVVSGMEARKCDGLVGFRACALPLIFADGDVCSGDG